MGSSAKQSFNFECIIFSLVGTLSYLPLKCFFLALTLQHCSTLSQCASLDTVYAVWVAGLYLSIFSNYLVWLTLPTHRNAYLAFAKSLVVIITIAMCDIWVRAHELNFWNEHFISGGRKITSVLRQIVILLTYYLEMFLS